MPVFTANVPTPLKVGDRIEIGGKIKENARKMSVNLCAQEGEEPKDVVLHFDVRFHRDNIISLSRKNGIWIGSGNYDTNYNMFVPGTIFRIIFEIKDSDVITIYCQGKFHSNFLPKIPISMAKYIVAWADVERITHCFFHVGTKPTSGDDPGSPGCLPQSPKPTVAPMVCGDTKRCQRGRKKSGGGQGSSNESSEDEREQKPRQKSDTRADRFFYEALMCQPPEHRKFGSPSPTRGRQESRKYREVSETEKNDSDYTEETVSKTNSSLAESEDILPELGLKKRNRKGRLSSQLAQVVNFMGKTTKRN